MATAVDLWFRDHKKERYNFLNPDALTRATVKLMERFSIEKLMWVLEESKTGEIRVKHSGRMGLSHGKPRDMRGFQDILLGNLEFLLDSDENDAESDADSNAQPDAQASAHAALYTPFDHKAALANRCRHS